MYERARGDLPDQDPDRDFEDRALKLATTFGGAGVVHGDLTPECAEMVGRVLDALSAPAGAEDTRTQDQRYHDALAEAMRRLAASRLLPERAGQPVKAWAHISLADLILLDAGSALQDEWTAQVRERWAARRAQASESGAADGAWLDGDGAEAIACDAAMAPIVTGDINIDALQEPGPAVRGARRPAAGRDAGRGLGRDRAGRDRQGRGPGLGAGRAGVVPAPPGAGRAAGRAEPSAWISGTPRRSRRGSATRCCCGTGTASGPAAAPSPPGACQVHHTKHKAQGGTTSVKDCVLLCPFHHQVVIHRWGWTLVVNPDGTTTAWNKNKTKVLHSHGPPVRPG